LASSLIQTFISRILEFVSFQYYHCSLPRMYRLFFPLNNVVSSFFSESCQIVRIASVFPNLSIENHILCFSQLVNHIILLLFFFAPMISATTIHSTFCPFHLFFPPGKFYMYFKAPVSFMTTIAILCHMWHNPVVFLKIAIWFRWSALCLMFSTSD
jgi:hypothetical protein